jgi:hypothetical protein
MLSSPTLSHFSSIILLQVAGYYQGSTSMMGMSMWYIILVPFFIMMVVLGNKGRRNTHDSEEEIEVDNTYHGDEKELEGYDENENDNDDAQKPKEILTPLWKYATRLGGGKGGWNHKIYMPPCHKT